MGRKREYSYAVDVVSKNILELHWEEMQELAQALRVASAPDDVVMSTEGFANILLRWARLTQETIQDIEAAKE